MTNKELSYVYGLLITDGSLYLQSQNRGKVQLEINEKDKDIVEKLYQLIPNSSIHTRERDTNYKKNYCSITFSNSRLEFREQLIQMGYPITDKTDNACAPITEYSKVDYWRGVIDGDGSIGFTATGAPFVSLVTKSEKMKDEFLSFLFKNFGIKKQLNRNTRDNVYNITVKNEDALALSKLLYENSELHLNRKYEASLSLQQWKRETKKQIRQMWTEKEIEYILTHTIKESIEFLGRTESSIKNKKFRVTK